MRTVQVECIVFRKKSGFYEFLLLKRIPKKGGFWQPVCGGVEESDPSLFDAALRELREEAGIHEKDILNIIENVYFFEINKHYLTGKPTPAVKEHVFGFEVRPNLKITTGKNPVPEHKGVRWASFEEALKLLNWENNKDGLKKLNSLLIKRPVGKPPSNE